MYDIAKSYRYVRMCRDIRLDYELNEVQDLDAPEFIPTGSVEGIYGYDPEEDEYPGVYGLVRRDLL